MHNPWWLLMEKSLPRISMVTRVFDIHMFTNTTQIPQGLCGFINYEFTSNQVNVTALCIRVFFNCIGL